MKKIKTIASAIIMIIVGTTNTFSQDHKHETSAHGGRIQDANGYHVELLNKNGYVAVYLLDNNAKPMSNKNITGNIILQFSDKTSTTVELTPKGDDGFSVNNEKASIFASCVVTFKISEKTVVAKFKSDTSSSTLLYQCPMKCEDEKTYDKAGKCPKCGMTLEELKKKEYRKHDDSHKH